MRNIGTGLHRGSHIPVLLKLLPITNGPILEMGCGIFSTPILYWYCYTNQRRLVTYENNIQFYEWLTQILKNDNSFHERCYVEDWDKIDLNEQWSIAFIDHSPPERREVDVMRLTHADYVVLHDSDSEVIVDKSTRRYKRRLDIAAMHRKLYKYHYRYDDAWPNTLVLSNKWDLKEFSVR